MASPTTDPPVRQDAVFAALASPVRRAVLTLLRERGAQPVHVIAAEFAMRRPSVSEHLKVLLACGLLTETRHGRERHYALRPEPLREVAAWLTPYEQFWRQRLGALDALLAEDLDDGAPGEEGDARDR
ncbi:metalloregulator ArsR/SmtB family transcription factor [Streptomyces sp. DSM 44915]|uniref:Metalloregulator ArsR/SmtB family transcription factor n=1 Tax=Streptomyces chisholmiae TaxID=3075540 RepID=A0ABU2K0G9_9ACTN|nr:metalloregulator ArsR/SmtB family transcription factor [Streptomyces sp. DSM 44915]MDT0270753.1 metalloregulator ArsR/SmtB family transcription factor [Streptomyces sp. DSM 44915]